MCFYVGTAVGRWLDCEVCSFLSFSGKVPGRLDGPAAPRHKYTDVFRDIFAPVRLRVGKNSSIPVWRSRGSWIIIYRATPTSDFGVTRSDHFFANTTMGRCTPTGFVMFAIHARVTLTRCYEWANKKRAHVPKASSVFLIHHREERFFFSFIFYYSRLGRISEHGSASVISIVV